MTRKFSVVICICLLAACSFRLLDATITVHVQDGQGKPIAGASVLLNANGQDRSSTTDAAGECALPIDSDSSFTIAVSAAGYVSYVSPNLHRSGDSQVRVTLERPGP